MRNKMKRLICVEEYVEVNGIEHYLFHRGTNRNNAVLLYLHGGPGSAESLLTETFQTRWEDIYTVVHWDQRGAGKTLIRNPDKIPTIELMLEDLYGIIQYLKIQYNMHKIVLVGHSWGSVLGSLFIRQYPNEIAYYIGVGQVINMLENERVGYNKVLELIEQAGDEQSRKKLEAIGEYPGEKLVFDRNFLAKCDKVRKIQGKYDLAIKIGLQTWLTVFKSPIFRLSDLTAFMRIYKTHGKVYKFLGDFNLRDEQADYDMPIYYVLGDNDWQTPYVIAQQYFEEIKAPHKQLFMIPRAGHMTMMDQPDLFFDALQQIHAREELPPPQMSYTL
ncbi:alpha/beta hydrolase [Paenibacillus sp. PR3]|uniref:prolyl aminopeptidase n=1 Tax=Paenibacillus terricola TaxID=2763503 RepID=A0ABR8MWS0_9BACL|nr:alpha/beta hydrolase [Paenibacillus terricola]MBD3919726.1 alpha/beta hydrolase [Paenibacillus terricola]